MNIESKNNRRWITVTVKESNTEIECDVYQKSEAEALLDEINYVRQDLIDFIDE